MNQTTPPCSTEQFQRELDSATVGRDLRFRIVWAPGETVLKVVAENGQPVPREYAKYPLVANETKPFVLGQYFQRNVDGRMVTVGYQKQGGLVEGNVLPTDVVSLDVERVNHSAHIFVIEQKLPDNFARAVHAKKREMAQAHLGFDLYGDFPAAGVWDWWADVSEHRGNCCSLAFGIGVRCRGLYREPNGSDLEAVRRAIKQRDERPRYVHIETQIEQAASDMTDGFFVYQEKQREERMQYAREVQRLAVRSIEKNSVYLDHAKRETVDGDANHENT